MQQEHDNEYLWQLLKLGDSVLLEEAAAVLGDFPAGKDDYQRPWIAHAIYAGALQSIQWMLSKNVSLDFRDDLGGTALTYALERENADRYAVLELLLQHNAPIHLEGPNLWTPAHLAAVRNDVPALQLLVRYGADLTIRTRIDNYVTPLEEARLKKQHEAVRYLESLEQTNV